MLCFFFMDRWSQCRFWFLISKYSGVMYSLPPESLSWKPKENEMDFYNKAKKVLNSFKFANIQDTYNVFNELCSESIGMMMKFIFWNVVCLRRLQFFFISIDWSFGSVVTPREEDDCVPWAESQISAHSLCDPVLHLIPLKQISSCCTSCVSDQTHNPPLFAPFAVCSPWVPSLFLCFPEADGCWGCKGSVSSQCFSESSCTFWVTAPFPLPPNHARSSVAFANWCTKEKC